MDHHSHDQDHSHATRRPPPVPTLSKDLDGDSLWKHLEAGCRWDRSADPRGAEEAARYIAAELESLGIAVTLQACEVRAAPSGTWRPHRFPVANIVPDGGTPLFVLAGGFGDAALLELARLLNLHRNELAHAVRLAFWNGGGEIGRSPAAWYADNRFDLLKTRCLAYFIVDQLADRSLSRFEPYATAELADWTGHIVGRLADQETEAGALPRNADASFLGVGAPCFSFLPPSEACDPDEMDRDVLVRNTGLCADALFDLCAEPRLPIDLMTVADVLWGELEVLSEGVGEAFDFGQVKEAVKELVVVLEDQEEEHEEMEPASFNRKMLDVCHLLNPVLYTEGGPYEHDAGGSRGVLPGLRRALELPRLEPDSHEGRLLHMRLVRERNRVSDMISRAILVARA